MDDMIIQQTVQLGCDGGHGGGAGRENGDHLLRAKKSGDHGVHGVSRGKPLDIKKRAGESRRVTSRVVSCVISRT